MTAIDHAPVAPAEERTDHHEHSPDRAAPEAASLATPHRERVAAETEPAPPATEEPTDEPGVVIGELRRVGAGAVARIVAVLASIVAFAWALGMVLLWLTADALGATSHVESLMRDLGFEGFRLAAAPLLLGIGLLGVVFVLACAVAALLVAAAFNGVAHLTGGVPVTVVTGTPAPHAGD